MNIVQKLKEKYNLSIWLDYLDKEILEILPSWVKERKIYGITTNPTIFNNAIKKFPEKYFEKVKKFDYLEVIEDLMIEDVKKACEIMLPIFEENEYQDGLVSIEVPPYIAYNIDKTIEKAKALWHKIDMPNVMIKIPATNEGIQALKQLYRNNININVTLLFSINNYQKVIHAYKETDSNSISVASFFVSRVDTVIDSLILKMKDSQIIPQEDYEDLVGKVAVANSLMAYEIYEKSFANQKKVQRILWASTSTKNPSYNPLKYVIELLTPNSINTIPLNTYQTLIQTEIDLEKAEKIVEKNKQEAQKTISKLIKYVNFDYILEELLYKGVSLFSDSYNSIIDSILSNLKLIKK
ncbi:MAG: transaldolase family protein [Candidatus Calescibacterium sp.]|nr:hypothetical protein [Candidatus Calescibacterium sp.]MCX7972580.1 hypothetical protein [bacterium]MDW8195785.1 transaldolase family protein [Candidatus Calescibacterium sp.]